MLYQWLILQDGRLPLDADGRRTRREHVCTATLIWPASSKPIRANSVLVDPCFSPAGRQDAELLKILLDRFPHAFLAHQCPEVADGLRNRLERN